jgi:uncharacterized protein YndB with AHSA1/START domain
MERGAENQSSSAKNQTTVERRSDRELVVTRVFSAPPRVVFEAWTKPELFIRWWTPKSSGMTLVSCKLDVRVGGGYRLEFGRPGSEQTMAFFGKYLDVVPASRLVWTNDEEPDGAVTTVTFTEHGGGTRLVLSELYPTKEALDASFEGMEGGMPEQLAQLDQLLAGRA